MDCYLQPDLYTALLVTFGVIAGSLITVLARWALTP